MPCWACGATDANGLAFAGAHNLFYNKPAAAKAPPIIRGSLQAISDSSGRHPARHLANSPFPLGHLQPYVLTGIAPFQRPGAISKHVILNLDFLDCSDFFWAVHPVF